MLQIRAKILYNERIKGNYFHLVLEAAQINKKSLPGQFLNIKVNNAYEPLLRRPFSIYRVRRKNIEVLYEVVGSGTEILSQKKSGEYLDIIGPLGNGFNLTPIAYNLTPILVAGGMGVAPILFLAEKLRESKMTVLIGAKTKNQLLCGKELRELGCEIKISTDDGSRGFKGKVTELLEEVMATRYKLHATSIKRETLAACSLQPAARIYACGPRPMLKEISQISKKYKIPAQVSLEEHMACGIGACLGCVVNTENGYKRVCMDGPVLDAQEIIW